LIDSLRRSLTTKWYLWAIPALLLVVGVLVYPLLELLTRSVTEASPEWYSTYDTIWNDGFSITIILRTVQMALTVTVVALILGYPYAYVMTLVGPRKRGIMTALVLLPFWTSLMARTFAWFVLLQDNGPLNTLLSYIGLGPFHFIGQTLGVTIGMAQLMLPFMVLPLYSTMSRIDHRLGDAAQSLGAPRRSAFRQVYFPLSMPGVITGSSLVFILGLGFYVTPAILGSPQQSMIAQLVATQVSTLTDFGKAGALSLILLVITGLLLLITSLVVKPSQALGMNEAEE
jgi:putative spermidine/putrescine transport system permease protein